MNSQALFSAQGKLLADAEKEVFELTTRLKENQHKIDRLHDYERQIEQHVRMQKLWYVWAPGRDKGIISRHSGMRTLRSSTLADRRSNL